MSKKAVVLLSGGIDSSVTLYEAKNRGFDCFCLIFDYGQRHKKKEINSAKLIAKAAKCHYKVVKFSLPWQGSSLLEKDNTLIPKNRPLEKIKDEIPSTYVPARNIIFLSFAVSFAEVIAASSIFIGANYIDYSGYPDCRPDFFQAFKKLIKLGTKMGVENKTLKIETPLIKMKKSEIIALGMKLKVPFEYTWSCYEGGELPCGGCDACIFRAKGFREAGYEDPLIIKE